MFPEPDTKLARFENKFQAAYLSRTEPDLLVGQLVNSTFLVRVSAVPVKRSAEIGCVKVPEISIQLNRVPEKSDFSVQDADSVEKRNFTVLENDVNHQVYKLIRLPVKVPEKTDGNGQLIIKTSIMMFFNR